MTLYRLEAWKDDEELFLTDYSTFFEAREDGEKYYPGGFDILELDVDGGEIKTERRICL